MGVPTSEVGYTSATARRGDHESSYEHVVALEKKGCGLQIIFLRLLDAEEENFTILPNF